jgi:hypothetical protein
MKHTIEEYCRALESLYMDAQIHNRQMGCYATPELDRQFEIIQELIDKQIPKTPIPHKVREESYHDDGYEWECPHCHFEEVRVSYPDCYNDDTMLIVPDRCPDCDGKLDCDISEELEDYK